MGFFEALQTLGCRYKYGGFLIQVGAMERNRSFMDSLVKLAREKAFIRTYQSLEFENKWLPFGRMMWIEENNHHWTTKYRTPDYESRLRFFSTEIWAPDWNEYSRTGKSPDLYVRLFHHPSSQIAREGILIALPRRLSIKYEQVVDKALQTLVELIPDAEVSRATRFWTPWGKFVNNISDMNFHEIEQILLKR